MRARTRAGCLLLACLLCIPLLSGCLTDHYTLEPRRLIVGTYPGFEPFTFKRDDRIIGFDIDLGRELAGRLGLEFETFTVTWDWLIPGLFSESYDIFISAMTITPERDAEIDFIGPYFMTNQAIVVREGSEIETTADLAGRTVGVLESSTALDTVQKIPGVGKILEYKSYQKNFDALESGETDVLLGDEPTCDYFSTVRGGTRLVSIIDTEEGYGIGILKAGSRLGRDIRSELTKMIDDGTWQAIYEKWFGEGEVESPDE